MHIENKNFASPGMRVRLGLLMVGLLSAGAGQAIDFGPFTLTGVIKTDVRRGSNDCSDCQRFPDEGKQAVFADELVQGASYGSKTTYFTLVNPYLQANFDLPYGLKLQGMVSQRWRNKDPGNMGRLDEDIPGVDFYAKNLALSHEDYGSVRIGVMPTRAWSVADDPYATPLGNSLQWAEQGAAYGVNTSAIRYTSRMFDVAEGDLVLEATYDRGDTSWKNNKPRFWELYAQFHKGPLVIDAMYQDARNGTPQAYAKGQFKSLTNSSSSDDDKLGGSGQGVIMAMARYDVDPKLMISGGIRRNRWSGAYAVCTSIVDGQCRFNQMFNVDWGGTLNGVPDPGYSATSVDGMIGGVYRIDEKWQVYSSLTYLGKADTENPSQRGQDNWTLVGGLGLRYLHSRYWQLHVEGGALTYGQSAESSGCGTPQNRPKDSCTLSPMSQGSNAFYGIDSRVSKSGNWVSVGVDFNF